MIRAKGRTAGVIGRPAITEKRARAMLALLEHIPASIAVDPDLAQAVAYIQALANWRLLDVTKERRAVRVAAVTACPTKAGVNHGAGRGRKVEDLIG
jgi:hypothetical protein